MLFSPVFISIEPEIMLARLPCLPRASRGAPKGHAVLPFPSLASGPQVLLLSKLKAPVNHAESTLLQVLILKQLKVPLESITFEKQGEGSPLWLTNCSKIVSARKVRWNPNFPFSVHTSNLCIPPGAKLSLGTGLVPIRDQEGEELPTAENLNGSPLGVCGQSRKMRTK